VSNSIPHLDDVWLLAYPIPHEQNGLRIVMMQTGLNRADLFHVLKEYSSCRRLVDGARKRQDLTKTTVYMSQSISQG
jgi:hypothetical protein